MKAQEKPPAAAPAHPDGGGGGDWFNSAANGFLDLILGPATEEELREQSTAVPQANKKRRKRTKKIDDHPVDFSLKMRTEAHNLLDRLHRREALEAEAAARKNAAAKGNSTQLVWLGILQIIQLFAVSQATLLVVFIPQKCPAINASLMWSPMFEYTHDLVDGHLCSLKENIDWFNMTILNRVALILNAVTLIIVLSAMGYFWMREVWLVDHLEESAEVPYDHLVTEFESYPLIEAVLQSLNSWAYVFATVTALFYVANFTLSTIFLFAGDGDYNYSLGPRTATSLVTNTMLIAGKIVGYLSYSRLSYKNKWAVSIFSTMPMSFNALDANAK